MFVDIRKVDYWVDKLQFILALLFIVCIIYYNIFFYL